MMTQTKGWAALLSQWGKDMQLWLYIVLTLQLFRVLLILAFSGQAGDAAGLAPAMTVLAKGLRYDISTAAVWVSPTFLAAIGCTVFALGRPVHALRLFTAGLYAVVSVLVFGTDLVYFSEYGDQFDQRIFAIVTDDTKAILVTVWKEYHPLLFLGLALAAIALNLWIIKRWMGYRPRLADAGAHGAQPVGRRVAMTVSMVLIFVAAVRGGTLWGEPIRLKHAFVVDDLFLNRAVVNPFSTLRYTLKTRLDLQKGGGLASLWPSEDIRSALLAEQTARGRPGNLTEQTNLDEAMSERVPDTGVVPRQAPARHVFLILMESHSGWTVMPAYRAAGFAPELSALARQGIYFPNFLPSANGTIGSLNALLTSFPDAGLNINYEPNSMQPYPSSVAGNFKRMGYKTRFFYGGFLSWQRVDSFAQAQGFDEVFGGGSMSASADTNEWGVDDRHLFEFVLEKVRDDVPSFNFILTTSNHPPYDLDLDGLGYPVKAMPAPLSATKSDTLKVLGHLWYADQQMGRFVRKAEGALSRPLFAVTGDHTARLKIRFPGANAAEQVAVPLVLYGPGVLATEGEMRATAGSHIDVPATLYELAAPAGFKYYSYGESLWRKSQPSYGLGYDFVIGEDLIATNDQNAATYALPGHSGVRDPAPELADVIGRFNALRALSWHRVRRGPELP